MLIRIFEIPQSILESARARHMFKQLHTISKSTSSVFFVQSSLQTFIKKKLTNPTDNQSNDEKPNIEIIDCTAFYSPSSFT